MKICENLQWNKIYLIGNKSIDEEHRHLFKLARDIEACQGNKTEVKRAIEALVLYTKFHFKNEEKYMDTIKYPQLKQHIVTHQRITKALEKFIEKIDNLSEKQAFQVLKNYIENYIIRHILIEDKKIYHFSNGNNQLKNTFLWDKVYKVGHEMIDKEHKYLFEIAHKTMQSRKYKEPKKFIKESIVELYTHILSMKKN